MGSALGLNFSHGDCVQLRLVSTNVFRIEAYGSFDGRGETTLIVSSLLPA